MSSCRMCDTCGTVFSERAEGWSSGQITVNKTDLQTGKPTTQTLILDKCPECTELGQGPPPRPQLTEGRDTRPEYLDTLSRNRPDNGPETGPDYLGGHPDPRYMP